MLRVPGGTASFALAVKASNEPLHCSINCMVGFARSHALSFGQKLHVGGLAMSFRLTIVLAEIVPRLRAVFILLKNSTGNLR